MRARRTDANHSEIAEAFEKLGFSVHRTNQDWDLTVGFGGMSFLIEVKDGKKPPSQQKLTDREEDFHAEWKGGIYIVRNVSEVMEMAGKFRQQQWILATANHDDGLPF